MLVHVADLRSGDIVSRDVFNSYGLFVLPAGTQLSQSEIAKLFQHQIDYIDIEPRHGDTGNEPTALRLKPMFEQAVTGSESLFKEALERGVVRQEQIDEVFQPLTDKLPEERDVVSILLLLNTDSEYTFNHSVRVGILAYYIAKWMGRSEEEALTVCKAGFLCDIGKCRIDPALLNKSEPLTEQELRMVRKYPIFGYEIVKRSFRNEIMARAVLQHLERMDGSGHPYGIKGEDIHELARVLAVADVCSAMISTRTYRERRDLLHVLRVLHRLSFDELDPTVVHTFIRRLLPFFIGQNGRPVNRRVRRHRHDESDRFLPPAHPVRRDVHRRVATPGCGSRRYCHVNVREVNASPAHSAQGLLLCYETRFAKRNVSFQ